LVYFQTKDPNFDTFLNALQLKMLVYIMAIWYILRDIGMFCGIFGIFSQVLACCAKKNLATLVVTFGCLLTAPKNLCCLMQPSSSLDNYLKDKKMLSPVLKMP
jgi:hypothetical protein